MLLDLTVDQHGLQAQLGLSCLPSPAAASYCWPAWSSGSAWAYLSAFSSCCILLLTSMVFRLSLGLPGRSIRSSHGNHWEIKQNKDDNVSRPCFLILGFYCLFSVVALVGELKVGTFPLPPSLFQNKALHFLLSASLLRNLFKNIFKIQNQKNCPNSICRQS